MRRVAGILAIALLSAAGCSRCDRAKSKIELHVLARTVTSTSTLVTLDDGTVLLDTGFFIYRVPEEGAVERFGSAESYAPFVPADENDLYEPRARGRTFFGTKDAPSMLEQRELWDLKNGNWTKGDPKPLGSLIVFPRGRTRVRGHDTAYALPPVGMDTTPLQRQVNLNMRRYADGTFVALGFHGGPAVHVVRGGSTKDEDIPIPGAHPGWHCQLAPSADGHAYADCTGHDDVGDERHLFELDGAAWKPLLMPSRDTNGPLAITKDGAVWMGLTNPPRLMKRARSGEVSTVTFPKQVPETLAVPFWGTRGPEHLPSVQTRIVAELDTPFDLAPQPGGGLVALVREWGDVGALVLFRVGGTAPTSVVTIGSEVDQHFELRNAEAPRQWTGYCRVVVVLLPREHDAGSLVIDPNASPSNDGYWVRGRLHDRTVTGVVFTDESGAKEGFDRAVTEFVDRNTTNPASPPKVVCTLPVLGR